MSRINKLIIIIHVGLFVFNSISSMSFGLNLLNIFGLSFNSFSSGMIHQVASYPFMETQFLAVLFNSMILWFIGSELEIKWGEKLYKKILMISIFSGAIYYLILSLVFKGAWSAVFISGLGGMNLALLVCYGIIFSERQLLFMMIFPMKAKYFCLLLAAIQLYIGIFSEFGQGAIIELMSAATVFLFIKNLSMRANGESLSQIGKKWRKARMKKKLSIVKDEKAPGHDPKNPKYWQ